MTSAWLDRHDSIIAHRAGGHAPARGPAGRSSAACACAPTDPGAAAAPADHAPPAVASRSRGSGLPRASPGGVLRLDDRVSVAVFRLSGLSPDRRPGSEPRAPPSTERTIPSIRSLQCPRRWERAGQHRNLGPSFPRASGFAQRFRRFRDPTSRSSVAPLQVAADNPHLGLLRPERCEGGHRTVYAGRREADVVMTSCWRRIVGYRQVLHNSKALDRRSLVAPTALPLGISPARFLHL